MKYLLCGINAKYIHSNLAVFCLQKYAAEHIQNKKDTEITIKEYTINHYVENILSDLYEEKPDVIIFSCYIWNIMYVTELSAELKKVLPTMKIWVGGPEVSYDADQFLKDNPAIDVVMQGEGEQVFTDLIDVHSAQSDLEKIPGIAYRREQRIVNQGFAPLMNLNDVPFVYEEFQLFEHKILYYETSRGCPYHCSYCLSSVDKTVRFRDLDTVKKELDRFLEAKVPQVKFVDRTFNCDRKRAAAIWSYLIEQDNGVTNFHFEISSDLLDDEALALFARMRPGLIQLEIGVQSTNPDTVKAICRHMNLEQLFLRVDQVHALGNIHQHLDLIAGLPYEDYQTFQKSFDDLYRHSPDQLQLGFLKVLKGTQMMLESEEHVIAFRSNPPYEVLSTKWLSYDEVILLKGVEEMVEIYYNSGQYNNILRLVVDNCPSPFAFYEKLSAFYRRNGYHKMNHTRMEKYQILRAFLKEERIHSSRTDAVMLYDMYLRENMKARPDWAKDLSPYKKEWKEIYRTRGSELYPDEKDYDSKQAANHSHIELFDFDPCLFVKTGEVTEGEFLCLFDYRHRNPLNKEARTISFVK